MSETVEVGQGTLRGATVGGIRRFLGVPFAAPPFGDLRMLPPHPAPSWQGERDATAYGPTVPKSHPSPFDELLPEPDVPGEDCLNLNVWTPAGDPSGLPVLVWIHGGAFASGSGRMAVYDGSAFARDGVVGVTINYRIGKELATRLGVAATRAAIATVDTAVLLATQAALSVDVRRGPTPGARATWPANMIPFGPEVDGDVLAARPTDAIRSGQGAAIELLVGWNTDENRLFMAPGGALAAIDDTILAGAAAAFGLPADAVAIYRAARPDAAPGDVLAAVSTDWMFRIPAVRVAEARLTGPGRTYMYEFAWRSPVRDGILGACHALELPFTFDNLAAEGVAPLTGEHPPQPLASAMHAAWVAFVTSGDPGWAPYDGATRTTMRFDTVSAPVDDPHGAERECWDGVR